MTVEQETKAVTLNKEERLLIQRLVCGFEQEALEVQELKSQVAQDLSLRSGGRDNHSWSVKRVLLMVTYHAYLAGQIKVDEFLPPGPAPSLTSRQKEVVKGVSQGKPFGEIKEGISPNGISLCLLDVVGKWGLHNYFQIMAIAARERILE